MQSYKLHENVFAKYSSEDGITRLDPEDDASKKYMGGVYGEKVESKSDSEKYIFLPASGLIADTGLKNLDDRVRYWYSTLASNKRYAYYFSASLDKDISADSWMTIRCFGMALRGVMVK